MDNSNNQNLTRYIHTVLAKLSASGGGGGDEPSSAKIEFVDTLPTASEDTVGIFYVIPNPDGNTGTIHITQNDGSTYSWVTVRDPETTNVQYTQQTLTEAQKQQARNNIDAASLADIENLDYVTAATLPTASAETMGHVYLIGPDASNNYERYYTQQNGSSYSWVDLGSTQLDLSTYATEEEVIQLEAKLNNLANTRYYGIFTSSADLPADASENGYAYVGSSTPLAIYEFDGEDWNDTGVTVNSIQGEPGVGFESVASPTPADGTVTITLSNGDTMTLDLNHNHPAYYSKVLETSNPSGGFLPDVVYSLGTLTGTVTFALAAAVTGNVNHYFWMFDTSSTTPTITWPTGITWADGSAPTVAASKHYEISVLNGIAYYSEV